MKRLIRLPTQQRSVSKANVSDPQPCCHDLLSPEGAQRMTELHDLTNIQADAPVNSMFNSSLQTHYQPQLRPRVNGKGTNETKVHNYKKIKYAANVQKYKKL